MSSVRGNKISIILPVFNAAPYITQAIQSILDQTYENWELLVCDDASTDDSWNLIDTFVDARIRKFRHSQNKGKTMTVNELYKETTGQLITIHDADDYSVPERLDVQSSYFDKNKKLVICGSNFITIDLKGNELHKSNLRLGHDELKEGLFEESQFHGPTVLFKKDAASRLDAIYRPFFKDYNEDYDFLFRLSEQGEVMNCEQCFYYYRITPNSLSRQLTPQKRCSVKLVQWLGNQRKTQSKDDLMLGNLASVDAELKRLTEAYRSDSSLIHREQAELDFYNKFFFRAYASAFKALWTSPLNLKNYRLLQHMVRKQLIGI